MSRVRGGEKSNEYFWNLPCRSEKPLADLDEPFFMLLVNTGTPDKYLQACDIFWNDKTVPAKSIEQFEEAGKAKEPVTHDPRFLIFGKQYAQRQTFIQKLNTNEFWRSRYHKRRIVTALNDVNTKVDKRSLTKAKLQKEGGMMGSDYALLVRASMKYLLAETNNLLKDEISWSKLTSDMEQLAEFDKRVDKLFKPGEKYILPIDFQSIDAFEILDVDAPGWKESKLKQIGPSIAVMHKSFAKLEINVDSQGKMPEFDAAIEHYIWLATQSSEKRKYNLDRCPLGIYWAALFNSMVVKGLDVTLSVVGHDDSGMSLRDAYLNAKSYSSHLHGAEAHQAAWDKFENPMDTLELLQNGFYAKSFELAMAEYAKISDKKSDKILFIGCLPTQQPVHDWQMRPKNLK